VLLALPDRAIMSAENVQAFLEATYRRGMTVVGFSAALVRAGALASVYSTVEEVVAQASLLIEQLASGQQPVPQYPPIGVLPSTNAWRVPWTSRSTMKSEISTAPSADARPAWLVRWPFLGSITLRVVLVACVPALLMCLVILAALYVIGKEDAIRAVRDRGELIALSLAQTGQYGLVSGNGASLERSIRRLVASDPSIESITLTDAGSHTVASVGVGDRPDSLVFVKDVRADVFTIDLLDNSAASRQGRESTTREGRIIGQVTVRMTSDTINQEWFRRVALFAGVVFLGTCLSLFAGLALAKRLLDPLREAMGALRGDQAGPLRSSVAGSRRR
jgi:hypothetical protein